MRQPLKILILGVDYAPDVLGIAPYTTGLAERFAADGHTVTVATTFPHYPTYRWTEGKPPLRSEERRKGVRVRRTWVRLPNRNRALQRILFDTSFAVAALFNSLFLPRQDVVIGVSVPVQTGISAGLLARLWRARSILNVQDLPIDAALSVGLLKESSLAYRCGRMIERLAYRAVDQVVVINHRFAESVLSQGVRREKVTEIPIWIRERAVPSPADREEVRRLLGDSADRPFTVLHAGNMGDKQGLEVAVDAAVELSRANVPIRVVLVGDGSRRAHLEARIAALQSPLAMFPLQAEGVAAALLEEADALLITQAPGVTDSVAPSKLLAYMAVGRPVVAAVAEDSITAGLLRDGECGIVCPAGNAQSLARAMCALHELSAAARKAIGRAGQEHAMRRFGHEAIFEQWRRCLTGEALETTVGLCVAAAATPVAAREQ